eukprot:11355730-Ditylum_brightwellii.AAC.1
MLVLLKRQIREEKKLHSCLKKLFYKRLGEVERKKRTKYICQKSLFPLSLSPWKKLLGCGDEASFTTRVHHDGKVGQGDTKGYRKKGKKRALTSKDCLGLVL